MSELTVDDIWSLDEYKAQREDYRANVLSYKMSRQVTLKSGEKTLGWLHFEDAITVRYQIQEMLLDAGEDSASAIQREFAKYASLVPNGSNFKATLIIDLGDPQMLAKLAGVARDLKLAVSGFAPMAPIDNPLIDEISTVYFLTWELTPEMCESLQSGASISVLCDNPMLDVPEQLISNEVRDTIVTDLF